jgi:hypothetical protein
MQATWKREERNRSIKRLLGLFSAVLLLALVGACRDQAPAAGAGRAGDEVVGMASDTSQGTPEDVRGSADEMAGQTDEATGKTDYAHQEAGGE